MAGNWDIITVMKSKPSSPPPRFDEPATYRIRVSGQIRPDWSDRLEGMTIDLDTPDAGPPVTTLVGELSDQAALAGVLDTLYEFLHLPVLSVECLSTQHQPGPSASPRCEPTIGDMQ
jgi:hypothetical protein